MNEQIKELDDQFKEKYKEMYCVDCLRGTWKRDHVLSYLHERDEKVRRKTLEEVMNQLDKLSGGQPEMTRLKRFIDTLINP